jgi:DNA-binding CsgD family transcriptional regulator
MSASSHSHELDALTGSERDVLALMAEGRSSTSIAQKLAIPASVVDEQVTGTFGKLGLAPSADGNRRVLLRYLLTLRSETRNQAVPAIPNGEQARRDAVNHVEGHVEEQLEVHLETTCDQAGNGFSGRGRCSY